MRVHSNLDWDLRESQLPRTLQTRWRLGAWAFLFALVIQGFPIGRQLSKSVMLSPEADHLRRLEATGEIGLENSVLAAVIWGLIYLLSLISIVRYGQKSFFASMKYAASFHLLVILVPLSAFWSSSPLDVVMNAGHTFGIVFVSFCAAMYYHGNMAAFLRHASIILGVNVSINLLASLLLPSYGLSFDGRWRGLTTNSNTLALISGVGFIVSAFSYFYHRKLIRKINFGVLVLCSLSLFMAGSVTVLVCVILSIALALMLKVSGRFSRNFLFIFFVFFPVFSVFFALLFQPFLEWILPVVGKTSTLSGRTVIWEKAFEAISAKPLLGWGADDRGAVIEYVYMATLHFHNGYLDVAVRTGFFGLILLLLSIMSFMFNCQKSSVFARVVGLTLVFFVCVYNMSEVSFLAPRNLLWILFSFMIFFFIPRNNLGYIR